MLASKWIKQAEKNGWLLVDTRSRELVIRCCKQGCGNTKTIPIDNLGPIPAPCDRAHEGQYARAVFDEYTRLVAELQCRRRSLGLSQEDVNAAAGLADGHINKLEAFHRTAQMPTLQL